MRFLVTGGAGFLGSALANRLARDGHTVRVLDDLSAGDPARLDPAVAFTRGDVSDVPKLWTLLQGRGLCVSPGRARVGARIRPLPARIQRRQRGRDGGGDGSDARCRRQARRVHLIRRGVWRAGTPAGA